MSLPLSAEHQKRIASFTLVELLIVMAILAILAAAVVIILNPGELLSQSRDSQRISDFQTIKKSMGIFAIDFPGAFPVTPQVVYISLPDAASPACTASLASLPPLPGGWSYQCALPANLTKLDGSGWLPFNFSSMPSGAPLPRIPIDPLNTAADNHYYAFVSASGSYELEGYLESSRFAFGGNDDRVSIDGGDEPTRYETGTNLALSPWTFDFKNFLTTSTKNGTLGWYKHSGSGIVTLGSDAYATDFMRATGQVWEEWQENIPYNPSSTYKLSCRFRQTTDPTNANKSIYCGWAGVAGDKTTYVNKIGSNSYSSQHYQTVGGSTFPVDPNFIERTGYTRGLGSPNGTDSGCSNPATPCVMHQNVRYLRPMFILNYNGGDGVTDMDSITISKY